DDEMPVPGVTVLEKGTTNGTATDFNGNYSITVPSQATLVFSYVGFETQEIPVEGQSIIDLVISPDSEQLSEVVLVGYGSVRKKDLTGAVSVVSMDENLTQLPNTSVIETLQGKVPGLNVGVA